MSIAIVIPDELAEKLADALPADERQAFALDAISAALEARQRDSTECMAAVEKALADMDTGRNLVPFEDVCREWDAGRLPSQTLFTK